MSGHLSFAPLFNFSVTLYVFAFHCAQNIRLLVMSTVCAVKGSVKCRPAVLSYQLLKV